MSNRMLFWAWWTVVELGMLGALVATVVDGLDWWTGVGFGSAFAAWTSHGMSRWVQDGQLRRATFAIGEWRRVAEHWRERFREHVTEAHPEVPAQVYMTTAAWPRCGLDNRKPENTP